MTDFTKLSHTQIASYAEARRDDMGAGGVTANDINVALQSGTAVLETRLYGFALVQVKPASNGKLIPHLWLLFVSNEHRGKRIGRRFVRELLAKHAEHYHMSLYCEGAHRRAFFGKLGFRVESKDGEMRRMTTNPDRR